MKLDWFFEMYLRQPKLPKLVVQEALSSFTSQPSRLVLSWETPSNMPFPMPIDVEIDGKAQRVEMKNGKAAVNFNGSTAPVVDPKGWVLRSAQQLQGQPSTPGLNEAAKRQCLCCTMV